MGAALNHGKKKKAKPIRLIPGKFATKLELLIAILLLYTRVISSVSLQTKKNCYVSLVF